MNSINIAALALRVVVGGTMIAHGWNHAFGGGRLPGTARWFESIGIRPGRVHALLATVTELGAGTLLVIGLLTPLAAAGVVGTMVVALVANHARNGFFVFRPGEGYEYVLMIMLVSCALGALGAGGWSVDHAAGLSLNGWAGLAIAALAGTGGAALLLATCWRPGHAAASAAAPSPAAPSPASAPAPSPAQAQSAASAPAPSPAQAQSAASAPAPSLAQAQPAASASASFPAPSAAPVANQSKTLYD